MTNDFGELFMERFFSTWIFSVINSLTKPFYARVGVWSLGLRSHADNPCAKGE